MGSRDPMSLLHGFYHVPKHYAMIYMYPLYCSLIFLLSALLAMLSTGQDIFFLFRAYSFAAQYKTGKTSMVDT
jgi:hypothetical protein